ncbi:UTP--glucose-1-phosphate uridylyltransferase [Candidatus Photodesmus katoptron]|uniref:UTP--glucose-1-phosphate uridylyltransferase n=1 Tax=Candidatus Photodesmus katoptron Akat1 TaxID=1236703 RepID=S3DK49_9GAMM|nr:UTP--glucose-1-phosphate uridylyltransferase GalU [Candidatus Photodesmus katoptron]EPE37524.1 UTP-glucose-1-phosphate uridylyltransferase [Candidatus Photodesmus katoptron Akat1]KEY90173.1 UTP--glucose-1-phosphate uridylyltransferase [Candidatus Photodesmus katoptron]
MIKKCLFPVAGYGTRFLPATKSMPKEMMPVVNKPLIEYGVEEAIQAGMNGMCIVMGRGKHSIMDHFDKNYELEHQINGTNKEELLINIRKIINEANFTYIRQHEIKGLGHAILTGQALIGNEPFAVLLADDLCINKEKGILSQMVELYKQFHCSIIAVREVPKNEIHKYGIISGKNIKNRLYQVDSMLEKPEKSTESSNLAIIGRYILTPDIFSIINKTKPGKGGEIQITDALLYQAQSGCVLAYQFKGERFDCGNVEGYIEATNYCFKNIYLANK